MSTDTIILVAMPILNDIKFYFGDVGLLYVIIPQVYVYVGTA